MKRLLHKLGLCFKARQGYTCPYLRARSMKPVYVTMHKHHSAGPELEGLKPPVIDVRVANAVYPEKPSYDKCFAMADADNVEQKAKAFDLLIKMIGEAHNS